MCRMLLEVTANSDLPWYWDFCDFGHPQSNPPSLNENGIFAGFVRNSPDIEDVGLHDGRWVFQIAQVAPTTDKSYLLLHPYVWMSYPAVEL